MHVKKCSVYIQAFNVAKLPWQTTRQASHLGFSVKFLSDATGTLSFKNDAGMATDEELHRATLVAQETFISNVISTTQWINSLEV